jgi:hypothetical protein
MNSLEDLIRRQALPSSEAAPTAIEVSELPGPNKSLQPSSEGSAESV